MQNKSVNGNAAPGMNGDEVPPIVRQIADTVDEAARQRLGMDDSPDDFTAWLETFAP